jgi:hypothetical protein
MSDEHGVGWSYGTALVTPDLLTDELQRLDAQGWETLQVIPEKVQTRGNDSHVATYRVIYRRRRGR